MNLRTFIHTYFKNWQIVGWTNCGIDCGSIRLVSGETCVKIVFSLNGERHWSGNRATVNYVKAC